MNLDYGPKKVYPNDMVTSGRASFPTDTVTRNVSQFTAAKSGGLPQSHNRKQRRRANRQLHRKIQIEKTVMSPNIYAPNVSINHLSAEDVITRHMSRHDKQAVQKQTREVKSSGYGDSPTLPPMIVDDTVIPILSAVPSQHQLLNSVEKMHQKKNRRHSPRSVKRKLMSPPITSRPSSAGSRI